MNQDLDARKVNDALNDLANKQATSDAKIDALTLVLQEMDLSTIEARVRKRMDQTTFQTHGAKNVAIAQLDLVFAT